MKALNMRILFIGLAFLALTGCMANQEPLNFSSSSGNPEITLKNISLSDAKNRLIDGCLNKGLQVEEKGNSGVICWEELKGGESILATLVVGNSYSTPPVQRTQFVLTETADSVRIVGTRMWLETQMAFGQTRTQVLDSNNQLNSIQNFLNGL